MRGHITPEYLAVFSRFLSFCDFFIQRNLSDTEIQVIIWHFFCKQTYRRIGQLTEAPISRQRVEQLIKIALNKIRRRFPQKENMLYL